MVLVTQQLMQDNYPFWSHVMLITLITKNNDDYVDGSITKPLKKSIKEHKQLTHCNLFVKGWILNTISPNITQSLMYNDNAFKI